MRRVSITIGLVALLATGCDSGDPAPEPLTSAEYQQAITRIIMSSTEAGQLFNDAVGDEGIDCAATVRNLHSEIERIVDDAAGLAPPADVAALHREFVGQARISADAVDDAASAAEDGELACGGREMNLALYGLPSTVQAERALMQIDDKGYDIFFE